MFDHLPEGKETGEQLATFKQGNLSTAEYALCICTLTAGSGWNKPTLKVVNRQGLNGELRTEMACRLTLDTLIDMSIQLGVMIKKRNAIKSVSTPVLEIQNNEPMQLGQVKLMDVECQGHPKERLCFYFWQFSTPDGTVSRLMP